MAKGDKKKVEKAIDIQMPAAQKSVEDQQTAQGQRQGQINNYYGTAADTGVKDYGNIMGGYNNFLGKMPSAGTGLNSFIGQNYLGGGGGAGEGGTGVKVDYGAINPAISGYGNFANTGGFSGRDVASMRARAVAPIRGIYDAAQRKVKQAGALNPGLSNIGASQAKLAREMSNTLADKTTEAEGSIAQTIQQGKLAGLGGLSQTGLGLRGQDLNAILGGGNLEQEGMRGQTSLYGTSPGMANMFGNQMLESGNQGINLADLRNRAAQGDINARIQASQIPSTFQNVLGNIGQMAGIAGNVAGAFTGAGPLMQAIKGPGGMRGGSGPAMPDYFFQ